jgi:hypothetical protein
LAAASSASWTQVPTSFILSTQIGQFENWVNVPLIGLVYDPTLVYAGDANAPYTTDGWITVPQGSNYVPYQGNMINLDSTQLTSHSTSQATVTAGNPAINLPPTDSYFGIRMRYRQHGSATSTIGGTCNVVAINNTDYTNVTRHPDWFKTVGNYPGVCMVDIQELLKDGCAGLTNSLTILFTACHPNLGAVTVQMTGPGGPYNFTAPTPLSTTGNWYGTAVPPTGFALGSLESCAYIVTLRVSLLLTTGDSSFPSPLIDQISFCKA